MYHARLNLQTATQGDYRYGRAVAASQDMFLDSEIKTWGWACEHPNAAGQAREDERGWNDDWGQHVC